MKNGPKRGLTTPTRGTRRNFKASASPAKSFASSLTSPRRSPKISLLEKNGKRVTPHGHSSSSPSPTEQTSLSSKRPSSPFSLSRRAMTQKGKETRDDVRDGKFFQVRLTFDQLEGLKMSKLVSLTAQTAGAEDASDSNTSGAPDVVCAYASISEENSGGEMRYTVSQPLNLESNDLDVRWPQADYVGPRNTSKRRLYQSILLRTPDETTGDNKLLFDDMDPSPYAPGVVTIHIGLVKGETKIPIGIASLAIAGQDVEGEQISLRIRPIKEKKRSHKHSSFDSIAKESRHRGLGAFLGKKKSRPAKPNTDCNDTIFRLAPDASIKIFVDVMSGMYEGRGPGLWGDLLDDEESFGPVPVVDVPDTGLGDLSNKYSHETVEVLNTGTGTTIISSPGSQYGEDKDAGGVDAGSFITPSIFSSQISSFQLTKKQNMRPLMMTGIADFAVFCGAMEHVDEGGIPHAFSFATTIPDDELDRDDFDYSQQISVSLPPTLAAASDDHETGTSLTGDLDIEEPSGAYESTINESNAGPSTNAEDSVALQSATTEVLSVGERTLKSVNRAKRTLHKYANKLGVKVEDLLDAGTASDEED